jgi:hypothetical protein
VLLYTHIKHTDDLTRLSDLEFWSAKSSNLYLYHLSVRSGVMSPESVAAFSISLHGPLYIFSLLNWKDDINLY